MFLNLWAPGWGQLGQGTAELSLLRSATAEEAVGMHTWVPTLHLVVLLSPGTWQGCARRRQASAPGGRQWLWREGPWGTPLCWLQHGTLLWPSRLPSHTASRSWAPAAGKQRRARPAKAVTQSWLRQAARHGSSFMRPTNAPSRTPAGGWWMMSRVLCVLRGWDLGLVMRTLSPVPAPRVPHAPQLAMGWLGMEMFEPAYKMPDPNLGVTVGGGGVLCPRGLPK